MLNDGRGHSPNINVGELVKKTELFCSKVQNLNKRYEPYLTDYMSKENNVKDTVESRGQKPVFSSCCVAPVDTQKASSPFRNEKRKSQKSGAWVKKDSLLQQSFNLLANKIDNCINKYCKPRNFAKTCSDAVPLETKTPKTQSKQIVKEDIMEFTIDGKEHVSIIVKTKKTFHFMGNLEKIENCREFSESPTSNNNSANNYETIGESTTCACEILNKKEVTSTPQPSDRNENCSRDHKNENPLTIDSMRGRTVNTKTQAVTSGSRRLTPIPEEKAEEVSSKNGMVKQT